MRTTLIIGAAALFATAFAEVTSGEYIFTLDHHRTLTDGLAEIVTYTGSASHIGTGIDDRHSHGHASRIHRLQLSARIK